MSELGPEARTDEALAAGSTGDGVIGRQKGVGKRTVWISLLTLLSRVLGLVRETISAGLFGDASIVYDAFLFAWRIPNLFRRFLGEGALSTALQTSLTAADARGGNEAGCSLFAATMRLLFLLLIGLCGVVMLAVWFLPDTLPGTTFEWLGPNPELIREFTLRLMPFVIFVCLTAAAGGALNVRAHYFLPALGPVVLNGVWIATLVLLGVFLTGGGSDALDSQLGLVRWLAWGVLLAGLAQLLLMWPALRKRGLIPRGGWVAISSPEDRRSALAVLKKSAPLALGAAVYQVNVMLDGLMAQSLLPPGGQTVHYLANRVQQFPLALVAFAATTAVFPALAALGQQRKLGELRRLHDETQRNVLFLALPATLGLFALSIPVTSALFEYGNFGATGVDRTAATLRMLCLAIVPAGAVGLVARTYYAMGDFATPVRISCLMLILNAVLNVVLIRFAGMDADGLALATTITSFGNLLFLLPGLRGRLGLPGALPGFASGLLRMLGAAVSCGLSAGLAQAALETVLPGFMALAASIGTGILTFILATLILRVPERTSFALRFQGIWYKMRGK